MAFNKLHVCTHQHHRGQGSRGRAESHRLSTSPILICSGSSSDDVMPLLVMGSGSESALPASYGST